MISYKWYNEKLYQRVFKSPKETWIKYAQKNKYAEGIEFKDIIELMRNFLNKLN